jgi:hypothetical protein
MHAPVMRAWVIAALVVAPVIAEASPADHCMAQLDARGVSYRPAARSGIAIGVEITGPLGGVTWVSASKAPLVIDCSLAVSLYEAGPWLKALGIETAKFSSAYSKRMVRGTTHPSKHSYGLAIDVPRFSGSEVGELSVALDFEQGLGDKVDCLGQPATQAGAILKVMQCQLVRSGLFHLVLSPDYDDAHHDHFHLEALPWTDRPTLRAERPAIY